MYMYNLLFNPNRDDGLFEEPPATPNNGLNAGLTNSKHWLKITSNGFNDAPVGFNFENPGVAGGWVDLGQAKTLLVRPAPPHAMFVRIAPIAAFDPTATLEFVAAFGRPVFQQQGFASPFAAPRLGGPPGALRAMTFFYRIVPARPVGGGWVARLSVMNRPGPPADFTHRYGFAVGVTMRDAFGQELLSFGEDPEFDVGG